MGARGHPHPHPRPRPIARTLTPRPYPSPPAGLDHDITSLDAWKDWFEEILVTPSRNASQAVCADYWSSVTGIRIRANSSASYSLGHLDQVRGRGSGRGRGRGSGSGRRRGRVGAP